MERPLPTSSPMAETCRRCRRRSLPERLVGRRPGGWSGGDSGGSPGQVRRPGKYDV